MSLQSHASSIPAPSRRLLGLLVVILVGFGVWVYWMARPLVRAQTADAIPGAAGVVAHWLPDDGNPGGLTVDQVAALAEAGALKPLPAPGTIPILNADRRDGRWFWFKIESLSERPQKSVLDLTWQNYDGATLYRRAPGGGWRSTTTGRPSRNTGGVASPRVMAFDIILSPGEVLEFFLHVEDYTRLPAQFQFWSHQDDFLLWERFETAKIAGFLCLLLPLVAYGVFGYATLYQRSHLNYAGLVVLFFIFRMVVSDPFGWGVVSPWREMAAGAVGVLINIGYCVFARSLFNLSREDPVCDRWVARVQRGLVACVVFLPLPLWPGTAFFSLMSVNTVLQSVQFFLLCVGIRRWRAGAGQAPLFVLGMSLFIFGRMQFLLKGPDVVVRYDEQVLIGLLSSSVGLLVFALANTFRHREVVVEHLSLRTQYTSQLEKEVAERTRVLQELSEQLKATIGERDRILAIIGHDLSGPASALQSLTHILARDAETFSPEELAELSREIDQACSVQLELLSNLLAWGGVQAGQIRRPQAVEVREALEGAWRPLAALAAGKKITLNDPVPHELRVLADPALLQAILRNLLANAIKFTRTGGHIVVNAGITPSGAVELCVRDDGVGIDPQRLAALFQGPVESEPGTRQEKGAGLGLSLCRDLARAAGGDIRLESESGKGTSAYVVLPVA